MDQGNNQQTPPVSTAPQDQSIVAKQPVSSQLAEPAEPIEQAQAISGPTKEHPSMTNVPSQEPLISPTEIEPKLPPELKEAGVRVIAPKDQPQVTPELIKIGVEPVKTAVLLPIQPPVSNLPLDDAFANQIIKTHPFVDSIYWLAKLILEQAKKMHSSLS
jgi:hypothetical protein